MAIEDYRVFVSYDHENDQKYRDEFERIIANSEISTVDSKESAQVENLYSELSLLSDEAGLQKVRDEILQDSVVTVVLVGKDTWRKKHVDMEIKAGLSQTNSNPRSGLIGILLPTYSDLDNNQYTYDTIPPRLAVNIQNGYAKMYPWDINLLVIHTSIYEAFKRVNLVAPDNSCPSFKEDMSGESWD